MAGEWQRLTWGDIARLEYGRGLRGYESAGGDYRVYGTNGPIGWHGEALSSHPTVVVGRKGAYRGIHYSPTPCYVIDTAFYLEPLTHFDMRWAYYELLTHDINGMDSGSAIPSTSRDAFYNLPVSLPPLPEQRAIAHILGTLDDKIELNRRRNATLEAMARALFKSWFVDFEPVRAKMEGRDTGLPDDIAALFPDRLVASEVGEVPEGWEVGTFGRVAQNWRRAVQPSEIEPDTPYIGLEHMPRHSIALSEWGIADELESNKHKFREGEILFGKLRPYFHKVGVAPIDGVCSTDIVVLSAIQPEGFGIVLGHASSDAFVESTNASSTGTKMPRTNWQDMARYPITIPPMRLAAAHTEYVRPLIHRIRANIRESRTLAALRDALLPKLLSGEVRATDMSG